MTEKWSETALKDFASLMRLSWEGDEGLRQVAALLRRGDVDPHILVLLASIIDPDKPSFIGEKLVIKRPNGHRPRRRANHELARFMERNIDFYEEKYEAVVAAAKQKFGVGKTACDQALARARRRQRDDPQFCETQKAVALYFRDAGIPEYEPLR